MPQQEADKTSREVQYSEWEEFGAVKIPTSVAVMWKDEGSPWSYWHVEGVKYNVDVSDVIPGE